MVIMGSTTQYNFNLSLKPGCVTLSLDTRSAPEVYSFDYEGRLWTAMLTNTAYRRGLDGRILAKPSRSMAQTSSRWLQPEEAAVIEEQSRKVVQHITRNILQNQARLSAAISPESIYDLERIGNYSSQQSGADIQHYHAIYRKVGILPPDQYMSVVLQATLGCSFNTCSFCTLYQNEPFHIKSADEFRQHALAVRDFLGKGISLRRTIFLGSANALCIPMSRLEPLLAVIHDVYDVESLGGIYAFMDGFSADRKSQQDYIQLRQAGLQRIYIGLESGSQSLLNYLHKPGDVADIIRAVQIVKSAGIAVGIIILLGAGGQSHYQDHIEQTASCLNAMHLSADDLIYFSDLVMDSGDRSESVLNPAGDQPLNAAERAAQQEQIEQALRFVSADTPHISRYDVREFVY